MVRLLADENFNGSIVRGLRRRRTSCDIVRAQDVGLQSADDAYVLHWAAIESRVLLTHDGRTIPQQAISRIEAGLPMGGVFIVKATLPIGHVIDDLELLVDCSLDGEWDGQIRYLPLT